MCICLFMGTHTCVFTVYLCVQEQGWPRDLSLKELPSPLLLLDANCPALVVGEIWEDPLARQGQLCLIAAMKGLQAIL